MIKVIQTLNKCYNTFNEVLFENELPKCIVNVQYQTKRPKKGGEVLGVFYPDIKWKMHQATDEYVAISVTENAINQGKVQALSTLVHEMCHVYCAAHSIEDVVRNKHTQDFKNVAEMAKLEVQNDKKLGWAMTYPTNELMQIIDDMELDEADFLVTCNVEVKEKEKKPRKKVRKYEYQCDICRRTITSKEEVDVFCKVCNRDFTLKKGPDNEEF